jgi:glycosyltransferase involved in cell wall biosynthesis
LTDRARSVAWGPAPEPTLDESVVCAVFEEAEIVERLVDRIAAAMGTVTVSWELVIVDDGSADETLDRLKGRAAAEPHLRIVELARNAGQVGALGAGLTVARGARIVTMDGDLQHDPAEIPQLLAHAAKGHDLVATWRAHRAEPLRRRAITWVGNRVNRFLTGLDVRDFGSTFRVIDARIVDGLRDRDGLVHYNTPALYAAARRPFQVPIVQHERGAGSTKWTLPMFISYNLDFVTASQRFVHVILAASVLGMFTGLVLYVMKLTGTSAHVDAASAPAAIAVSSLQLALIAIVWREVIQAQRFAKGVRPWTIRRIWRLADGAVSPERAE